MKLMTRFAYVFLVLAAIFSGVYFYALSGLVVLDDNERQKLPGQFLKIEGGTLSYTRDGEENAPIVVLVHGFSTPKFVWDQTVPVLVQAGYQVIRYDHFGRGFSDRPNTQYDAELYRNELLGLLDGLNIQQPVNLVGYSMGGANVIDFTAEHGDRVKTVTLIAPAGFLPKNFGIDIVKLPVVGEWVMRSFGAFMALESI